MVKGTHIYINFNFIDISQLTLAQSFREIMVLVIIDIKFSIWHFWLLL